MTDEIRIADAYENNLKHVSMTIPKGKLASRINGKNIVDYGEMTARELVAELRGVTDAMGVSLARQISAYLERMDEVGIGYLSLSRKTDTLSGGEIQWLKLASELGRTGQVYVMDEPSTGLHNKDLAALLALFRRLVDGGNTVVIVEHRLELIAQADWVIDMGPGGGSDGGEVVFTGTPRDLLACPTSKTAHWLQKSIM